MIEILGLLIEIPGFSFEILGTSKICGNRIPDFLPFFDISVIMIIIIIIIIIILFCNYSSRF